MNSTANLVTTLIPRAISIELLALDLSTCSRCKGSLTNLEQAIADLQQILANSNTVVQFDKILVESEVQAKQLQFVSSPTIRVNGQDISLETTESPCGECSKISGFESGTGCRTWLYQGESHSEAPVSMIVEALLRAMDQTDRAPLSTTTTNPFELPQNLKQFFQDKGKKATTCGCGCS